MAKSASKSGAKKPTQSPDYIVQKVRELFQNHLKEQGLRNTKERLLVLDEVYALEGHFDADQLFSNLKAAGVRVSRATVYNTLELLVNCNLVGRHQFGQNLAKYEKSFGYWQHDHLICLDCNKLLEFCDPRIQAIQNMIEEIYETKVSHHSLEFYGHCQREVCPNK